MILHTVNKSPLRHSALRTCLQFRSPDEAIVLMEDGVYAAAKGVESGLDQAGEKIYAIRADVEARGLSSRLRDGIHLISYVDFVDLCAVYDKMKNWS